MPSPRPSLRSPRTHAALLSIALLALAHLGGCGTRASDTAATARDPRVPGARPDPLPRDPTARLARYVATARAAFRRDRALELVRVADRGFRARGNAAYVATLDAVEAHLRAAGFAPRDFTATEGSANAPAVVYRETMHSEAPVWDARAATLELVEPVRERLMGFDAQSDAQRTMLVAYAPGGDVMGELVRWHPADDLPVAQVRPETSVRGRIVLTDEEAGSIARQAARAGALAVLSGHIEPYNDPARHPDAVPYAMFHGEAPERLPLANLSPAVYARLSRALEQGKTVVHLAADVSLRLGRVETLVARVEGRDPSAAPIVLAAHADEPGANDNASGVGGLAEAAATYARLVRDGALPRPARPVVFLFGMEIEQSVRWLELHPAPRPAFAVVTDMIGEGPEISPMLIERMPDPGAARPRGDDRHSSWWSGGNGGSGGGAGGVRRPGAFLSTYVIAAMRAVDPRWVVRDHPYEGGSDHVAFLARGVPAVLLWHFPDDAYHTSRDRLARVSGDEIARVAAGLVGLLAHGAQATPETALDVLAITSQSAQSRLAHEVALSRAELASTAPGAARERARAIELAHLDAWTQHFDDALRSCARLTVAPAQPGLLAAIALERGRLRDRADALLAALRQ